MMSYGDMMASPSFWAGGVIGFVIFILYLVTLFTTLQAVAPANRRMEPGLVFLMLIPLFNLVWHFFVVIKMRDSLQAEFAARSLASSSFGYGVGLAMCILWVCGIIPLLGLLCLLAAIILWIVYWVQIAGYKRQLKAG